MKVEFNNAQKTFSAIYAIMFLWVIMDVWIIDFMEFSNVVFFYIIMMIALSGATPSWNKNR